MLYYKPIALTPTHFKSTINDFYALDSMGIFSMELMEYPQ
jgi:hypothetical protein